MDEKKIIELLIIDEEKDYMKHKVQETIYTQEAIKPIRMGKADAEERLGIVQTRMKNILINIEAFKTYLNLKQL